MTHLLLGKLENSLYESMLLKLHRKGLPIWLGVLLSLIKWTVKPDRCPCTVDFTEIMLVIKAFQKLHSLVVASNDWKINPELHTLSKPAWEHATCYWRQSLGFCSTIDAQHDRPRGTRGTSGSAITDSGVPRMSNLIRSCIIKSREILW